MDRIVIIRHGNDPPDDRVYTWVVRNGFEPHVVRPFAGECLGKVDDTVAGTVIHGGPFNVYETDRHPFLLEEYRWIGACLDRSTPMLGICQGAQQIAWHLGAYAGVSNHGRYEFGYYEITPTVLGLDFLPQPMMVCQSHFHTFAIPDGGVCLAGNEAFPHQAFRYGSNVYGLQFHAEVTIEGFRRWQLEHHEKYGQPGAQTRGQQDDLMHQHDSQQAAWFYAFLDGLFLKNEREQVGRISHGNQLSPSLA